MGNSKTNVFFTPEKYLCGIIQGPTTHASKIGFYFFWWRFIFFPLSRTCAEVLEGDAAKDSQNGNQTPIASTQSGSGPIVIFPFGSRV